MRKHFLPPQLMTTALPALTPLAQAMQRPHLSSLPRPSSLALLLGCGLLATGHAQAAPGVPQVGWMETNYALVEVDQATSAYAQLLTIKQQVDIPVSWDKWSGDDATTANYKLNGETVLSQALTDSGAQSGNASIPVSQGGRYQLSVSLCNADGCTSSASTEIVVADTDGSHTQPLQLTAGENNQPYVNNTDSVVGAYFVEWGVYGRKFPVDRIPAYNLNHILYGFLPICGGAGINDSLAAASSSSYSALQTACAGTQDYEVAIHDPWAALQKPATGQDYSTPYKGNYGQMMELKQAYPDLSILPSIGGWTFSDPFFAMADPTIRARFIASLDRFLRTWKFFGGVDIDWEYPGGNGANPLLGDPANDGATYVTLMRELRQMLDRIEADTGRSMKLTSAIGAAPDKIALIDYQAASQYMDRIFVMSYDYYGAWSMDVLGHQTPLHNSNVQPDPGFNASAGVDALLAQGVDPAKIVVGTAMYGRGWKGVSDYGNDTPFQGVASGAIDGTWEAGSLDYRDIADNLIPNGFEYHYDAIAEAPWLFKPSTGELVTYDDPRSVRAKGNYVTSNGLGGLFAWEIDADNGDILNAMHQGLGHAGDTGGNHAPIARAGADQDISGNTAVTLNGDASSDADGDSLSYSWTQLSGPAVALNSADQVQSGFQAPAVSTDTPLEFQLSVNDGELSGSDTVVVTLLAPAPINTPPGVSVSSPLELESEASGSVTATANDADGDALSYQWTVPAGFSASGANSATISLTAPAVTADSSYQLTVTVSDGQAESSADLTVNVTAPVGGGSGGGTGGGSNCDASDPNAASYPTWDAASVYLGGDRVSHNKLVWEAKWWIQGSSPSVANEAWQLISTVEMPWSADIAYNGNDEVNYDGRRWNAKWWTKGDQPGVADVWVDVGAASCNP